MTRNEAIACMQKRTPVIYTGPGSMGRSEVYVVAGGKIAGKLRGSRTSIGIITDVRVSKAIVRAQKHYPGGSLFPIKHLHKANAEELRVARAYNRKYLPNLEFYY